MGKTYRVSNSQEALNLANKFKSQGRFNLFRGQNEDWPLVPSVYRLSNEKKEKARQRLLRLMDYLYSIPETVEYADSADLISTIAQHYGIPTDFIDFSSSPEIALFFATHSKKDLTGKEGIIICINKSEFIGVMDLISFFFEEKNLIKPYIYEKKIDNLWRLQAQKGCFMQLSFGSIEALFDYDKIIFPHDGLPTPIKETDVYPKHKSDLELLLDNYFAMEQKNEGYQRMMKFSKEMGIKIHRIPKVPVYKYVKSRKQHPSWESKKIKQWRYQTVEPLPKHEIFSFEITIRNISSKKNPDFEKNYQEIKSQLKVTLKGITRKRQISPSIQFCPQIRRKKKLISSLINRNVRRIWDGMRTLPYTKEQIVQVISKYLAFELWESVLEKDIEEVIYDPILLSMSNSHGTYCRFHASGFNVARAFRDDVLDIQDDALPQSLNSQLLLYIQKPRVVFDFDRLLELFVKEIIATQVLRSKNSKDPTLFFSPAYINRLGYA